MSLFLRRCRLVLTLPLFHIESVGLAVENVLAQSIRHRACPQRSVHPVFRPWVFWNTLGPRNLTRTSSSDVFFLWLRWSKRRQTKRLYNRCFGQAPRSNTELIQSGSTWLSVFVAGMARKQLTGTQSSKGGTPSEGCCDLKGLAGWIKMSWDTSSDFKIFQAISSVWLGGSVWVQFRSASTKQYKTTNHTNFTNAAEGLFQKHYQLCLLCHALPVGAQCV